MALEEVYDCGKLTTETERHPSLHDSSLNEYSDMCQRDCRKKCTRQSFHVEPHGWSREIGKRYALLF